MACPKITESARARSRPARPSGEAANSAVAALPRIVPEHMAYDDSAPSAAIPTP